MLEIILQHFLRYYNKQNFPEFSSRICINRINIIKERPLLRINFLFFFRSCPVWQRTRNNLSNMFRGQEESGPPQVSRLTGRKKQRPASCEFLYPSAGCKPERWNSVSAVEDICRPCWLYARPLSTECKRRISSRDTGDYPAIKVLETREDIGGKNTRLI